MTAPVPSDIDGPAGEALPKDTSRFKAMSSVDDELGSPAGEAGDLIERLKSPLPVCPFDRRSPDYWMTGGDGKPCHVCGGTEEIDKCRGADTRVMDEAASALAAYQAKVDEAVTREMHTKAKAVLEVRAAEAKVAALTAEIADKHSRAERYKKQRQWLQGRVEDLERAAEASEASAAALRTALEPFAAILDDFDPSDENDETPGTFVAGSVTDYSLTLGDFRRARAALPAKGEG